MTDDWADDDSLSRDELLARFSALEPSVVARCVTYQCPHGHMSMSGPLTSAKCWCTTPMTLAAVTY